MDFQPYFKVHHLVSVHPKNIIVGQMNNLNMIFHVLVSVYWFLKIWNSPKSIAEFRNSQWHWLKRAAKRWHMQNATTIVYLVRSFDIFLFQGSRRHSNKQIYRRDQNRWPLRVQYQRLARRHQWDQACRAICAVNPFSLPVIRNGQDLEWKKDYFKNIWIHGLTW